jgi:hypothetical protein
MASTYQADVHKEDTMGRLKNSLKWLAIRAAAYSADPTNRTMVSLEEGAVTVAEDIEELIEDKIKEVLREVRVIGDKLWDGS